MSIGSTTARSRLPTRVNARAMFIHVRRERHHVRRVPSSARAPCPRDRLEAGHALTQATPRPPGVPRARVRAGGRRSARRRSCTGRRHAPGRRPPPAADHVPAPSGRSATAPLWTAREDRARLPPQTRTQTGVDLGTDLIAARSRAGPDDRRDFAVAAQLPQRRTPPPPGLPPRDRASRRGPSQPRRSLPSATGRQSAVEHHRADARDRSRVTVRLRPAAGLWSSRARRCLWLRCRRRCDCAGRSCRAPDIHGPDAAGQLRAQTLARVIPARGRGRRRRTCCRVRES